VGAAPVAPEELIGIEQSEDVMSDDSDPYGNALAEAQVLN